MTFQPFIVKSTSGETLPGLPTPMLISQGGGEAWQQDEGIWRARDDQRDPPGTKYTRVRVVHMTEFYVDVEVQNMDPSNPPGEEPEPFMDTVRVVAETATEAAAKAPGVAIEYWQGREDVPYMATVIRVSKEFH